MDEIAIGEASFPNDLPAVAAIDTTFATSEMLTLERVEDDFRLSHVKLDRPVSKTFPLDDIERRWEVALIGKIEGRAAGFASGTFQRWNRRLVVSHFYVDRAFRRRGVGTALMNAMIDHGTRLNADHLWIEASNLNTPAIAAYRHWGFTLCGLDTTLYGGTPVRGEIAIFLSRPVLALAG
jgi:ribosomal protein S18 acetylase RimI-like enzyme